MKVGYQGTHGTFSEIAVKSYFKDQEYESCSYTNFHDILNDLDEGILDAALLPVENSTTGTIYRTYDLLHEHRCCATGEQYVRIVQNLKGQLFEYCFYVDFEGSIHDELMKEVLGEIVQHCVEYKLLGCYPKADSEELR